jgi:hypothetical protein
MTLLGAFVIISAVVIVLGAKSHRHALLAMVAGAIFVTQGQGIYVAGFSLFSTRILEIAGILRVILRKELRVVRLTRIDKTIIVLNVFTAAVYCIRSTENLANQIGISVDWILAYFIFRSLIQGLEDFRWFLRKFIFVLAPFVVFVLVERHQGRSLWYSMGGLNSGVDWTRNGVLRCEGSFRHPSLMGSLGASFLAGYLAMVWSNTDKQVGYFGSFLCLMIVWASNSGGPLSFAAVIFLGWIAWRIRAKIKWVFRGMLVLLAFLAVIMKAPVWFLLERISAVTGGDGWHRSELIDQAVNHFGQWWLAGMDFTKTTSWFAYLLIDVDSADICNQFIMYGLQAGIGAIALFITQLVFVFKLLSDALHRVRKADNYPPYTEYFLWGLGVLMVGHIFNWFGITYFDQTYMIWAVQLAAAVSVALEVVDKQVTEKPDQSFYS